MEHAVNAVNGETRDTKVKHVSALRPLHWLSLGWDDLAHNPVPSISHGLILAALGWLIIVLCSTQTELLALSLSGFLLVGPIAGAGFYALSRLRGHGEPVTFDRSLDAAMKNLGSLSRLGIVLAVVAIVWGFIASSLFQKTFGENIPEIEISFYRTILEWQQNDFLFTYVASGAVLAVIAFVVSVVAAPMLFDRGGSTVHAIQTSIKATAANPLAMMFWAALIAALTLIGFATLMAGLVITLPLIGHATWHAYQDLVN